jgi:glycosyltransferase involved in cell wall biosynthesis
MTAIGNMTLGKTPVGSTAPNAAGPQERTKMKLSVVIPAYNEEDGIANIIERVLNVRPAVKQAGIADLELIVVDDGSKDRTAEIVRSYPDVRLIQHARNRNYGGALKTGFHHATGELLAFLDADGTYPPEFFPRMCEEALKGADMVVGTRMAGEKNESPAVRKLGNFMFAKLVSLIGNTRVTDVASGMRVFRRDMLPRLYPLPDGLNFTPAMSTRAIHEGVKLSEVPIPHSERLGRSKLGVLRDGWRFLSAIVWTALTYNPARILGGIGLFGVLFALIVAGALAVMRVNGVTELSPTGVFTVHAAVVLAVVGVSLFTLGMTFNYLVSLFHKRTVRQSVFGKPLFSQPLDRQFWWIGGVSALAGLVIGGASLGLSFNGWPLDRLWFWLLCSAMLIVIGVQLVISWFVMRTLEELSQREGKTDQDLLGSAIK